MAFNYWSEVMKVFTYSEARQNLSKLLSIAQEEEIEIRRRDGSVFVLRAKERTDSSPFDVPSVRSNTTVEDTLDSVRESRQR